MYYSAKNLQDDKTILQSSKLDMTSQVGPSVNTFQLEDVSLLTGQGLEMVFKVIQVLNFKISMYLNLLLF